HILTLFPYTTLFRSAKEILMIRMKTALIGLGLAGCLGLLQAQEPGGGARGGGAAQTWWVHKTRGGVYPPPMRPLWKLADLKKMQDRKSTRLNSSHQI